MVLAKLTGGITHGFEGRCNSHRLCGKSDGSARLPDSSHAGANRKLTSYEIRPACSAACLSVVVSEAHAFCREFVEIRRPASHQTLVIRAEVPNADVVAHDDNDVGFLFLRDGGCGCHCENCHNCR